MQPWDYELPRPPGAICYNFEQPISIHKQINFGAESDEKLRWGHQMEEEHSVKTVVPTKSGQYTYMAIFDGIMEKRRRQSIAGTISMRHWLKNWSVED
jgi:hypothetical protein